METSISINVPIGIAPHDHSQDTQVPIPLSSPPYPDPLIIHPSQPHKQTFIILHGRGSNASRFGQHLFSTVVPSYGTITQAFPHAKLILPTASKRQATGFNRSIIRQWFDNWTPKHVAGSEVLYDEGLRETSLFLHGLLRTEIEAVGTANVVLWGLSQGCAASLVALLTWSGAPIGAAVGMCGWLPFGKSMQLILDGEEAGPDQSGTDDEVVFERADDQCNPKDSRTLALEFLFEETEWPGVRPCPTFQQVPVFLGHGSLDEKVPVCSLSEASSCLSSLGMKVQSEEYPELDHWYSPEMLRDIFSFLKRTLQ